MRKNILLGSLIIVLIATSTLAEDLSRKELRAIGQQYIQAWESGSFDDLKNLFVNPDTPQNSVFSYWQKAGTIKGIDLKDIEEGHISLGFTYVIYGKVPYGEYLPLRPRRWLLLTPDGKIKYDSILVKHPIEVAEIAVSYINWHADSSRFYNDEGKPRSPQRIQDTFTNLKDTGIPMFDLNLKAKPTDIKKSLVKIRRWLKRDGRYWDISEPKIPYYDKDR